MSAAVDVAPVLEPTPSPLRLEPAEAFQGVREVLRAALFEEIEICKRLGIESLDHLRALRDGRPETPLADGLDVLIRLFLDNEALAWSDADRLLPSGGSAALRALGLVREHRRDPSRAVANVLLYPTEGLYIASDVVGFPDVEGGRWWDLVYAAITTNTRLFLSSMPRSRCEAFLDLCSGTGIAALVAGSGFADRAWAVDVADRSTEFARFNARLNGIDNVIATSGDLYEPVAGLTFDRIVAHPPYVPSRETRMVYRDGGADGEGITRRIIAGLPEYLRPGGVFHCTCTATDHRDTPLEQRLRTMLGPTSDEFDIAVVVSNEFDPTEYYVRLAIAGRNTWQEAEEWHRHFASLGVEKLVYATIAIIRHTQPHAPFTVRRKAGSATTVDHIQRLVHAAGHAASPEALGRMLDSRPRVAGHVSLQTEHGLDSGGWAMRTCALATSVPFDVRLPCPPSMVGLVGRLDGLRSVRDIYAAASTGEALSEDASIERLASYIHMLAAHGLVELEHGVTA